MSSNDNLSRLVALFDENVKTLTQLWEEIGVEQHERAESLRSLRDKLHNIVTDTTRVEKEKKSQLIAAIEDSRKRAQQAANALGIRFEQAYSTGSLRTQLIHINHQLEELLKQCEDRKKVLGQIFGKVSFICNDMGVEVPEKFSESDLSDSAITHWKLSLSKLEEEKSHRISQVNAYRNELMMIWGELNVDIHDEFDLSVIDHNCGCSLDVIGKLERKLEELKTEKFAREAIIQDLAKKITALWDLMDVSEEDRNHFFSLNTTLGLRDIQACKDELNRLEVLKTAKIKEEIVRGRQYIDRLWEELGYSDQQRATFEHYHTEDFSEIVFEEHQKEIQKLEAKLQSMKNILDLIHKRENLKQVKKELEAAASDKSRLLTKKSNSQRLLQEEKMRKSLKQLPAVEASLKESLLSWEKSNNQYFYYQGVRYLVAIEEEEEERKPKTKKIPATPSTPTASSAKKLNLNATGSFAAIKLDMTLSKTPNPTRAVNTSSASSTWSASAFESKKREWAQSNPVLSPYQGANTMKSGRAPKSQKTPGKSSILPGSENYVFGN